MAAAIPMPGDCCKVCDEPEIVQVPGPQGTPAAPCVPCNDGLNAFSATTAQFTVPAINATVTFDVAHSEWAVAGQTIVLTGGLTMEVMALPSGTQITARNPTAYSSTNPAPGTVIPSSTRVAPSGVKGATGAAGAGTLNALSPTTTRGDLIADNGANAPNASDVRFGTGGAGANGRILHADSTQATGLRYSGLDVSGAASVITGALPITNGGSGQATQQAAINALLNSAGSTAGDLAYFNGTNWTRLPRGTALQVLRTNATPNGLEYWTLLVEPANVDWPGTAPATTGASTLNWATGLSFSIDSTGNLTIDFSNTTDGQSIVLALKLNGGDTLAWTPTILWKGGMAPTPTGGGATDLWWFQKVGTNFYGAAALNFA